MGLLDEEHLAVRVPFHHDRVERACRLRLRVENLECGEIGARGRNVVVRRGEDEERLAVRHAYLLMLEVGPSDHRTRPLDRAWAPA